MYKCIITPKEDVFMVEFEDPYINTYGRTLKEAITSAKEALYGVLNKPTKDPLCGVSFDSAYHLYFG